MYESKGKQLAKSQPKYPVGLTEEYVKEAQLRREQEQRKLQQKQNQQASIPGLPTQQNKKKKKKKSTSETNPSQKITILEKSPITEQLLNTYSSPADNISLNNEEGGWTTVTSKSKSKTANNQPVVQQKNEAVKENNVKEDNTNASATDPAKRIKNLKKRLREIDLIEEKKSGGAKLDKDQVVKLKRRPEIEREIEALMGMLGL